MRLHVGVLQVDCSMPIAALEPQQYEDFWKFYWGAKPNETAHELQMQRESYAKIHEDLATNPCGPRVRFRLSLPPDIF